MAGTHTTPEKLNETIQIVHERFIANLEEIDLRDEFDRNYP